ncbi:MAG: signal recognition particle-docking protein FtsY [Muribaculaceae bacterium]|nr:signal recognition particle-docking protein FtsY [Muribaculaceae bacterium]MDE6541872.1 signal recognition particle-docking protein FtsY [Muribaculaceae bacterium]
MAFFDIFSRKKKQENLDRGLEKTKEGFFGKLKRTFVGRRTIDDDFLDELEEIFITSDVGAETTLKIIDRIQARAQRDKYVSEEELNDMLCEEISSLLVENKASTTQLQDFAIPEGQKPYVIMVVGVNGVGKTTTIGKLAHQYKAAGHKVMLGAADTFRAAAIEQLDEWARRADVPIVRQQLGSDAAAVAFDTLSSAVAQGCDVVIIDTAGRLHNKKGLMDELSKIKRVMERVVPGAPQEVLLVLDGSTGQNAFEQARQFSAATQVTDLAITKLDGTARGGVVIGISDMLQIPVKYIGLGEKITDLQVFDKRDFVASLFGKREQK